MINAERLFRDYFVSFLNKSTLEDTPYYSTCSWTSIEDYLRFMIIEGETNISMRFDVNVEPHRSRNNLASFSYRYPLTINLNSRKMNRRDESIAGSIAHEFVHLVDYQIQHERFGHPSLRFWNKRKVRNSAPYIIGREFKKHLLEFIYWS